MQTTIVQNAVPALQSRSNTMLPVLAGLTGIGLTFLMGCATGGVNPPRASENTGYVDVHANPSAEVRWEVARSIESAGEFRGLVISCFDPSPDGILRLALAPGPHWLRLTCLNRLTTGPTDIEVEVEDGKVTPVCVTFAGAGTARGENEFVHSRYGQRTIIPENEEPIYRISATAGAPLAYRCKSEMPYARQLALVGDVDGLADLGGPRINEERTAERRDGSSHTK